MNKPISEHNVGAFRRFFRNDRGEALIGFALSLPLLVVLTLGTLEVMLAVFDYHRAGDATRRAARTIAIGDAMVDQDVLQAAGQVTCSSTGTAVTCGGAAALNPTVFTDALAEAQSILPTVQSSNLQITYVDGGVGDITTPGGLIPVVTARLVGLRHDFLMVVGLPGFASGYTFDPMTASRLAGGMGGA